MVHTEIRKTNAQNYLMNKMDERKRNSVIQEENEDDLSELVNSGMGLYEPPQQRFNTNTYWARGEINNYNLIMSSQKKFGLFKAAYCICAGVGYTAVGMHLDAQ